MIKARPRFMNDPTVSVSERQPHFFLCLPNARKDKPRLASKSLNIISHTFWRCKNQFVIVTPGKLRSQAFFLGKFCQRFTHRDGAGIDFRSQAGARQDMSQILNQSVGNIRRRGSNRFQKLPKRDSRSRFIHSGSQIRITQSLPSAGSKHKRGISVSGVPLTQTSSPA